MKWCWNLTTTKVPNRKTVLLTIALLTTSLMICYGQNQPDPVQGIKNATQSVTNYFAVAVYLMYAIGAIAGIVGAIKTFNMWNQGDPNTTKTASAWFGSCLFLVVVATILKTVFGV